MYTSLRPTSALVASLAVGALLFAACGGSDTSLSDPGPSTPASASSLGASGTAATFNDADVVFAQGMIPHHAQAVEMAALALAPEAGASPEIKELATAIQGAQDPEIELMTGWLQSWGQPVEMPEMDGMDDMSGMGSMDGMMTAEEMTSLAGLTGPEFDTAWTTMMIAHHKGAISQAETVKANGTDADVRVLADQIISAQQGEITTMQALLAG